MSSKVVSNTSISPAGSNTRISDGSLGVDGDTQFIEYHTGLIRELFGNGLLFFAAGNECFYRIAEPHWHPDNAMRAVVLVQERDSVGGMASVINDAGILRDFGQWPAGQSLFQPRIGYGTARR